MEILGGGSLQFWGEFPRSRRNTAYEHLKFQKCPQCYSFEPWVTGAMPTCPRPRRRSSRGPGCPFCASIPNFQFDSLSHFLLTCFCRLFLWVYRSNVAYRKKQYLTGGRRLWKWDGNPDRKRFTALAVILFASIVLLLTIFLIYPQLASHQQQHKPSEWSKSPNCQIGMSALLVSLSSTCNPCDSHRGTPIFWSPVLILTMSSRLKVKADELETSERQLASTSFYSASNCDRKLGLSGASYIVP